MQPVPPVTAALFLALLCGLTLAALSLPRFHGAQPPSAGAAEGGVWAAQCLAGTALLLAVPFWYSGPALSELGVLAASCLCAGAARAILSHPGVALWAAALPLPYAWAILLRPTSHRRRAPATPPGACAHRGPVRA
jgi:hypothetical protein